MQWYYAVDGEQRGPLSDADFLDLVKKGTVRSRTQVWNESMTDWQPFQEVKGQLDQLTRDAAGGGAAEMDGVLCNECQQQFSRDNVIEYQGMYVCGSCKAAFFQRIQEGGGTFVQSEGGTGETLNAELTANARAALQGNWGMAVAFSFLYMFLVQCCQIPLQFVQFFGMLLPKEWMIFFQFGTMFLMIVVIYALMGVFQLGSCRFYLDLVRGDKLELSRLFYGFKHFRRAAGTFLLMMLLIFLWSCLLIIPGIIASFSYAMAFYVLADNPELSAGEALARSKKMMSGNRFKLFCLGLRFIGWGILAVMTCYIGMLWLMPYISTSFAAFYEDVRGIE